MTILILVLVVASTVCISLKYCGSKIQAAANICDGTIRADCFHFQIIWFHENENRADVDRGWRRPGRDSHLYLQARELKATLAANKITNPNQFSLRFWWEE